MGPAEIAFLFVTVLALAGYHLLLAVRVRTRAEDTAIGCANRMRARWVASVMADRRDILAVQTVRNWIMAATFLASTSILIGLGLLGAAWRPAILEDISHALNLAGTVSETLWMAKLFVLIQFFFVSFFSFTSAIRYYNHASVMINTPGIEPEDAARVTNRGALYYTIGVRGFYLAVPVTLWLFGPMWMAVGALVLIAVLGRMDRAL